MGVMLVLCDNKNCWIGLFRDIGVLWGDGFGRADHQDWQRFYKISKLGEDVRLGTLPVYNN